MGEMSSLQIDHNHPLFLASTDTPGLALHDIKLTGHENYDLWSRSMRMTLLVKNKLGQVRSHILLKIPVLTVNQAYALGLYNGKVMGICMEDSGLYVLKWRDTHATTMFTKDTDESNLWHMRLGHPSTTAMKHIFVLKNKVVDNIQYNCEVCPLAKQSRLKFPLSSNKTDYDFRRYTWVYLLQSKSEVITVLKDFLIMIKTHFSVNVKVLSNLPKGDKFAKRARKSVFIGYSEVQKGYRLFDLDTKTIFVSRDVIFREHIFPFRETITELEDSFSTQMSVPIQPDSSITPASEITAIPDPGMMEPTDAQGSRKTIRTSKPPVWLKDYQTTKKFFGHCLYPLSETLTYANLTAGYQAYLQAFSIEVKPSIFQQASTDSRWVAAMQQEIKALEDNHAWEIMDLPAGKQAIGSKWVYKIK
ncbi:uncharacterized protein LOC142166803 [Nicotiana tabacum]|uniref:Uncharacterized protein LOC142166803 n=1 Tax=Nicotiana tabacum TaxID=4097 RepID=A0AC58SBB6_TOBAC